MFFFCGGNTFPSLSFSLIFFPHLRADIGMEAQRREKGRKGIVLEFTMMIQVVGEERKINGSVIVF